MADQQDDESTPPVITFTPASVLATVPAAAALLLRDHIKGLEAEAGTARAETTRAERAHAAEVGRLRVHIAAIEAERDRAIAECAEIRDQAGNGGRSRNRAGR